jgi:hypothetical protein
VQQEDGVAVGDAGDLISQDAAVSQLEVVVAGDRHAVSLRATPWRPG